jgi:Uma2 family endonuclease
MGIQTKLLTFEDYLLLPEISRPYEIIRGELRMTPAPSPDHQWIAMNVYTLLRRFVAKHRLGVVLAAPLDVVITCSPLQTRQPDVLFLSAERTGITGRSQLRKKPVTEIIPDLVIEVLSPNDSSQELNKKLRDYQTVRVRECWLASPEAETIEVFRISPEIIETISLHGVNETLRSELFPEFEVDVREVFE